jgi:AraC-like DNA-binding protein
LFHQNKKMEEFQIKQPSALLAPYIKEYWFLAIDNAKDGAQRCVPTGYTCVAFHRGNRIYSSLHNGIQPSSYLCGQSLRYSDLTYSGNLNWILIIFKPAGAKAFFKIPMHEVREQNISLELLDDIQILELEKRLTDTYDNNICIKWIEDFLIKRIYCSDNYNFNRLETVINAINNDESDINTLAQISCLGYKQFKRLFTEHTGLNPKEFLQINRFQKALHIMQMHPNINLNKLAYDCGYYDKSHLIKEIKRFTGYTPNEYISATEPYSEYLSLFRSFFIDKKNDL